MRITKYKPEPTLPAAPHLLSLNPYMEFCNAENEEEEYGQAGNSKRMDLLRLQLKIIRLLGIFLPSKTSWSGWKYKLFINTATLYFLLYVPQICAMFISIYEYWGNIDMITKILFQIMFGIDILILTLYFILRGKKLAILFDMLETNFIRHTEKVVTPESKRRIITEASKRSMVMTYILISIFISVTLGWSCLPLILRYVDNSVLEDTERISEEMWKYYCYILWLPNEMSKPSAYKIIYLYQVLVVFASIGHYTACNTILFFLMFHTATHFKLLISSFEDMREVLPQETVGTGEPAIRNDLIYGCCTIVSNCSDNAACIEEDRPRDLKQRQCSGNIQTLPLLPTRAFSGSRMSENENLGNVKENAFIEEKIIDYLINCIQYHQAILEYCKIVKDFLSPMFLVYFLTSEAMMCTAVFQVALGDNDGLAKFVVTVGNVCCWPLMICWCGDYLTAQSVELKKAAYGCVWYSRSQRFKQMLHMFILRSQEPVTLTAGKFYTVSLETFAAIANTVYAYFTILKHMHES